MSESANVESLRDSIRKRVADGSLPVLTGSAWAGQARGDHRCACCHRTIRHLEMEYEAGGQVDVHAHIQCFTLWLAESRLLGATARRPPAKMPPDAPAAPLEQTGSP